MFRPTSHGILYGESDERSRTRDNSRVPATTSPSVQQFRNPPASIVTVYMYLYMALLTIPSFLSFIFGRVVTDYRSRRAIFRSFGQSRDASTMEATESDCDKCTLRINRYARLLRRKGYLTHEI